MKTMITRKATGMRWGLVAIASVLAVAGWASAVGRDTPGHEELLRMHDDFVLAFVQSEGFGRMRVTPMMRVMSNYRTRGETPLWVQDLQLIGIARHDPPVVFSSAFQGFQHSEDGTALAPRRAGRPLTGTERADVRALEDGQRLVVRPQGDALRVVGPISAGDECLGCHKDKRAGDLLGAFVYTLRPLPDAKPAR
ncbi:MAG: hypothetical protein V4673_03670 [Pseudomonadota bacterium]